jgi:hypothetical protein
MECIKIRSNLILGFAVVLLLISVAAGSFGQVGEEIDNARVIEMAKKGFDDEVIIAKIKTGTPKFSLTDDDLIALKNGGVSGKVIAAMLDASVLANALVKIDDKSIELHTLGQAKVGGRLGSFLTSGIKSVKQKAYLQGKHSSVVVSPNPKIEVELPPNETIDNYIIVKMDKKGDRRELEVGSAGGLVGGKAGLRAEDIVPTSEEDLGGRHYKIVCQDKLKKGEYLLYVVGSADAIKGIYGKGYDFTVE